MGRIFYAARGGCEESGLYRGKSSSRSRWDRRERHDVRRRHRLLLQPPYLQSPDEVHRVLTANGDNFGDIGTNQSYRRYRTSSSTRAVRRRSRPVQTRNVFGTGEAAGTRGARQRDFWRCSASSRRSAGSSSTEDQLPQA
jgi:hypothetical protein